MNPTEEKPVDQSAMMKPPLKVFTEHELLQWIDDQADRFGLFSIQKIDPNKWRVSTGGRACEGESLRECLNNLIRAEK